MKIDKYEFDQVCEIEPLRGASGSVLQIMPQSRYKNAATVLRNRYGSGPFCKFRIPNSYRTGGVYILTIDGEVQYVGECANLSSRFNSGSGNISPRNCYKGGQETNCRLNNLIYLAAERGERVSLWFFQTNDYKAMERALLSTLTFAWNRK
jgi:hypothetical protein